MSEPIDPIRAIGMAGIELHYAAAELRSLAAQPDSGDRGVLYNLADRIDAAAERLQSSIMILKAEMPGNGGGSTTL